MSPPQQPRPPRRRTRAQAFAAGSSRPSVADASTEMRTSPPRSQTPLYTPPTGTGLEDTKPPLWSIQYSVLETEEPTTPGNTSKRRRKDRKRAMGQKYPEHPHDDDDLGLPIFQDSYMTRILPQIAALGVKPDTQLQTPFERAPNHPGPSPTVSASDYSLETGRVQAHIVPRKYAMTQARFRVVSKAGTRVFLQPQLGFGISSTYKRVSQDGVAISAKDVQYDNDVQGIVFADWIEPKREGMLKEQDRLTKLWANKAPARRVRREACYARGRVEQPQRGPKTIHRSHGAMTPEQEVEFQRLEEYGLDLEHETPDTLVRGFLFAERHEIREAIVRFRQRFKSIEMPRAKAYEQEECILAALRIQELVSKLSSQVEAALMELLPEKQVGGLLPADKTRVAEAIALDREQDAAEHGNDYGLIKARIATWIVRDIGLPESTQEYRLMRELSRVDEEPQDPANFNVPFNVLLALRRKRGEAEPESVHRSFPSSMVGRPTTCAFGDVSRLSMHVLAEWQPKSQEVYDYLLGYTEERYGGSLTGVEAGAALDRWLAEHPFPRNVVWDNDGVVNSEEAQNDTTVGEDAGTRIVNDGDINPDHNSLKTRGVRTGHLDGNLRHID